MEIIKIHTPLTLAQKACAPGFPYMSASTILAGLYELHKLGRVNLEKDEIGLPRAFFMVQLYSWYSQRGQG
jgi:hypothetical protein